MIEICMFFYLKIRNFDPEKEVYLEKECASIEGEKSLEREVCLRKECGVKGGRKNLQKGECLKKGMWCQGGGGGEKSIL
jgi:hypothetical protein